MKIMFYSIPVIIFVIGIIFIVLSISSRKQPELGLVDGLLRACPLTPNCVCSEQQDKRAYVAPLSYSIAHANAWRSVKQAIIETGGEIVTERNGYLHARYITPLMRYVDDVELRMDEDRHIIHIRSASRVGHSDLGANRQRVKKIRGVFANL